jgi:predicted tellurium resistance membrane protein TerC
MYNELDPNRGVKWVCLYLLLMIGSEMFSGWSYRRTTDKHSLAVLGAIFALLVICGICASHLLDATHETTAHYIGALCGGVVLTIGRAITLRLNRKMDIDGWPRAFTDRLRRKMLLSQALAFPIIALSIAVGFACYKLIEIVI